MAKLVRGNFLPTLKASQPSGVRRAGIVPAVCGFLLLAVLAVFLQTAWHDFVNYDDPDYVFENWHVREGLSWDGLSWARKELKNDTVGAAPKEAAQVLTRGDVIYVVADDAGHAQLAQMPEAQGALVALDPNDGSIVALVGGFDYFTNKYNRVTQARRLPGSGFKPYVLATALTNGYTLESTVNGTSPSGLSNTSGQFLQGQGSGHPGTNYVQTFGEGILAGPNITASMSRATRARISALGRLRIVRPKATFCATVMCLKAA